MAKKKQQQKFYAIKVGRGVEDKIVTTWEECKKYVIGCHAVYKSFVDKDDAKLYLKTVDVKKVQQQTEYAMKNKPKVINVNIPDDLYDKFVVACDKLKTKPNDMIIDLIKELIE